jgi:uncharacterized membrane protein YqaE (UPF0057 family)
METRTHIAYLRFYYYLCNFIATHGGHIPPCSYDCNIVGIYPPSAVIIQEGIYPPSAVIIQEGIYPPSTVITQGGIYPPSAVIIQRGIYPPSAVI